jgi:hypothetical protein
VKVLLGRESQTDVALRPSLQRLKLMLIDRRFPEDWPGKSRLISNGTIEMNYELGKTPADSLA